MKKFWKNLKRKFGNGFTFLVVPNSTFQIRSITVPFSVIIVVVGVIIFNLYIFVMFTTQVFTLSKIRNELSKKDHRIVNLKKEQGQVKPTLERTAKIAMELNDLKVERERIFRTWQSIQKKGGRSFSRTSRGIVLRLQPNPPLPIEKRGESTLERLKENNLQLSIYLKEEVEAQKKLLKDLMQFEKRLDHTPSIWPVSSFVTSWFGIRKHPIQGYYKEHTGVDLEARYGTKVRAAGDGVVDETGFKSGYGYTVIIEHGYGYETLYGHNSKILVHPGQVVKKGQIICLSGNSGTSTGPHLHYEVHVNNRPVNPTAYLQN